jgi:LmbE family N-acetylglucosaminyl deacetylase
MEKVIYLSPHLDDAVLSCGAIIWNQINLEDKAVEVWTVFAGDPPRGSISPFAQELHQRWQTTPNASQTRRSEDTLACERLGCKAVHLEFPDCIYRFRPNSTQPRIMKNKELFRFDPDLDSPMIDHLSHHLKENLPENCTVIVPLGVGGHIDHQITRLAAETLRQPRMYFADFPYAADHAEEVSEKTGALKDSLRYPISPASLHAWQFAVSAYVSQISSFWSSFEASARALESYAATNNGNTLWK